MSTSDQPASLIKATLLGSLEKSINAALINAPNSLEQLRDLSGRLIAIHSGFPLGDIFTLVVDDGVELFHASSAIPDVSVTGSVSDLAALVLNWTQQPQLIGGHFQIQGDRELLQQLQAIATELDVDWGALLSPYLGDNLAQQVDYGGQRLLGWLRDTRSIVGSQLKHYLANESSLLPPPYQIYEFCQDIDELRYDVDRLDARIARLKRRRETSAADSSANEESS